MQTQLSINKYYNFSVYANSILGSSYNNAQLVSILNYQAVSRLDGIDATQKQVYPYLPEGTPRDHTKYIYYHFKVQGKDLYVADFWIIPGSVTETSGQDYVITLFDVTDTQVAVVRDQLRVLGIRFDIK